MVSSTIWAPVGEQGPPGPQGPAGPAGPQGPAGVGGPGLASYNQFLADLLNSTDPTKGASLVGGVPRTVTNIVALKALLKTNNSMAMTLGYYAAGDGGAGTYFLDSADGTSLDNGGTIIVAADGGRWKLLVREVVSVRQFGAKGDGIADDTTKVQAAIIAGYGKTIIVPPGYYMLTATINIASGYTRIIGSGIGTTNFGRSTDYGYTFVVQQAAPISTQSVSMSDFSVVTTGTPTNGAHILVQAGNGIWFDNISLGDCFIGIDLRGCYNVHMTNLNIKFANKAEAGQRGIIIRSGDAGWSAPYGANISIVGCDISTVAGVAGTPGALYGLEVFAVDGLWVSNTYFGYFAQAAVKLTNSTAGLYLTGLMFSNCWMDNGKQYAFQTSGSVGTNFNNLGISNCILFGGPGAVGGILIQGNIVDVKINNCEIVYSTGSNIILGADVGRASVSNCIIRYADSDNTGGGEGIEITSGTNYTITGNQIFGESFTDNGIFVRTGGRVVITGNIIAGCINGVAIATGVSSYIITNNCLLGNSGSAVADSGTTPKVVANNLP